MLEAVGIDFELQSRDVAARGNFCSIDGDGLITDRRAGRIATEKSTELCQLLDEQVIEDTEIIVRPVREHRFVVVFRGNGLSPELPDSDPQQVGVAPLVIAPLSPKAEKMARVANHFVDQARSILAEQKTANMILLRGFSQRPHFPTMSDIYKLKPAAIATYPMYRGLARLVGMEVLETGTSIEDEFTTLARNYGNYDFFFLHVKATDSSGEDGDFDRKVRIIEQVDNILPELLSLQPDVIVVTGDHSTPAILKGHSWHPVPVLLYSECCRTDKVTEFSESACILGGLGRISAVQIMPLAMANALKLTKFGA